MSDALKPDALKKASEVNATQGFILHPEQREAMEYDVVIVGAGPAGLSAAIRLKQQAAEHDFEISVCVLEKGAEVGAHILSGAVIDPVGLDELIPDWRDDETCPVKTEVKADHFMVLGPSGSLRLPNFMMPPLMNNHGNYIASLGNTCKWLAEKAEALGVEIYPGFAAAEVLYNEDGSVKGVATGDMGIGKNGEPKDGYMPGMELLGKYTFFAEGVRGSLSKHVIRNFDLDANCEPQKFGIGIKTGGGSFLYHFDDNLVAVGFVVHLNYSNPYLSPFDEFQRFKTHPSVRPTFEGGKRLSYGARAITEGGFQSVPKLSFPGGVLVGCSAGFVNVPRIKGSHNAMATGMMAADSAFEAIRDGRAADELTTYQAAYETSHVAKDLKRVRNVKPLWSKFGTLLGIGLGGIDMWMNNLGIGLPFTLKHGKTDAASLKPAAKCKPIDYPKPDGVVSFDKLSSVFLSSTNHEEDQPAHLTLGDPNIPIQTNLPTWAEPAQRFCPAGVYEVVSNDDGSDPKFQINAQNCVHCKTCDIKDPSQNINWVVPEGGGGPIYVNM